MSYFRRKRRRDEARDLRLPEVVGRPFRDSTVVQTGDPISWSRRSLPRREFSDSYDDFYGGYGAPSPMLSRARASLVISRPRAISVGAPAPLLQAPIPLWRAMRILRMDPAVKECVGRRVRKQVLFAKKVAGRSGGSPGPYHRTILSGVSCK